MSFLQTLRRKLSVDPRHLAVYVVVYTIAGFTMNHVGHLALIAEFTYWWQVPITYVLYLIPVSLYVRDRTYFDQYLHGLLFLALWEIPGYATGSSIAHDGNILDRIFSVRNFSLVMTVWFGVYLPAGNRLVAFIAGRLFK